MRTVVNPPRESWDELGRRPTEDSLGFFVKVLPILESVKTGGDSAVRELTRRYDGIDVGELAVESAALERGVAAVPEGLKAAIRLAIGNVRAFHESQIMPDALAVETSPGVLCWRKRLPLERIGLYIPGGSAPLFSTVYMLGVPAVLAGCKDIVLCSPPGEDGEINPAVLFTAREIGIERIFRIGGAQAIAAMAFGTESVPKVDKIFGPGNQWVTVAKQIVSLGIKGCGGVSIDLPAGPSEVLVIADERANPPWVAADLLSQAEHDVDSQVVLVTTELSVVERVTRELVGQLEMLPRRKIASAALANSIAVVFSDQSVMMEFVNRYAPEHLILETANAEELVKRLRNAGSVFVGDYTPEVAGDYISGTNHVLPTGGYARSTGGVSVESFTKTTTFQRITEDGLRSLAPTIQQLARAEALEAHARAAVIRLEKAK